MVEAEGGHHSPTVFQRRQTTTATITITADAGHRYYLRDIFQQGLSSGDYIDVYLANKVPLRLYAIINDCVLVDDVGVGQYRRGFFEVIRQKFPDVPRFNTADDEDLAIKASATPTRLHMHFDDIIGGDTKTHTIPGASDGFPRLYIGWCTHSQTITSTDNYKLDTPLAPVGAPQIKDGYVIPGSLRMKLLGLIFGSAKSGSSMPTNFHIWDGMTELFCDDHSGFPVRTGNNELAVDIKYGVIFLLDEPYVYEPNSTMYLNFDAYHDGANNIAAQTEVAGLILLIEKAT